MMNWEKWNDPYDVIDAAGAMPVGNNAGKVGPLKMCFFILTFDATAAGPAGATITGTTYDPTNHYTTDHRYSTVAGLNLKDLWGIKYIHQIEFSGLSSDPQAKNATASSNTGTVKPQFIENGQYIKLTNVGCGRTAGDPLVGQDETELDNTALSLNSLRFTGVLYGS